MVHIRESDLPPGAIQVRLPGTDGAVWAEGEHVVDRFFGRRTPGAGVRRPERRDELAVLLAEPRAITFVSVEWSGYERHGRPIFTELADRLTERHTEIGAAFWILREDWEGMADWFTACAPPVQAATGYGAVVWLEQGRVVATEEHAARAGIEELEQRTLRLWSGAERGAAPAGGDR